MPRQKIIKLKQAKKVFPDEISIIRPHDLISASIDKKKFLTRKEQEKIQRLAMDFRNGFFDEKCDLLVTRKKDKLKFEKFC